MKEICKVGFEAKELGGGNSSARFTYRVIYQTQGLERARLEAAPEPLKVAALPEPPK